MSNEDFKKFDGEKPQLAFLPFAEITEIAKILDFGAAKYDRNNWKKGCDYSRMASAALRHLFAWIGGEDNDPETGLSHLSHAVTCILFLMYYARNGKGTDDRAS